MNQAKLAFYTGKGGAFNDYIRLWTGSPITHVELVIDGTWYSSSHLDGGVRSRRINGDSGHWEFLDIDCNTDYALAVYSSVIGCGYDWTGIIGSQILPFGIQWPNRYFCSELVGEMLGIDKPHRLAPHELYERYK